MKLMITIKKSKLIYIIICITALLLISSCQTDNKLSQKIDAPIVFMSRADHPAGELYLMLIDGSIKRLTDNERHENNPAFSMDRSEIVYHGGIEGDMLSWEIFMMDLNTGVETRLTNNRVTDGHPDWTPDGSSIVYSSFVDTSEHPSPFADIFLLDLDSMVSVNLTDTPYEDNDPEVSPDGSKIAFKSTRYTKKAGKEEIYVMDIDGLNVIRLTDSKDWQSDHDPSWDLDSKTIYFERFEGNVEWFEIGKPGLDREKINDLTPWNNYEVSINTPFNIKPLTSVSKGQVAFLPVVAPNDKAILYMLIEFIFEDSKVIGATHKLNLSNLDGSMARQYPLDDRHIYTLEYFDW